MELSEDRQVCKFKLSIVSRDTDSERQEPDPTNTRDIPIEVKIKVWGRDKGACVECGATDNLHFDHVIPYSKGGSSLTANNVQLLCARHNLAKHDRII